MNSANPSSPQNFIPFDMEGYEVRYAFKSPDGVIINVWNEEEYEDGFFYAPPDTPNCFYALSSYCSDWDPSFLGDTYGFCTHDDKCGGMYLYISYVNRAYIAYGNKALELEQLADDKIETWTELQKTEQAIIQEEMLSGKLHFFSPAADQKIDFAFNLSNQNNGLNGIVAFCSATHTHNVAAYFLPKDAPDNIVDIAFFQENKRLSYNQMEERLCWRGGNKIVSTSIGGAERTDIDFSTARRLDDNEINELAQSGLIPSVPIIRTPLMTPLLYKEKMREIAIPSPQPVLREP